MILLKKLQNKIIGYCRLSVKRSKIKRLFRISANFIHNHSQSTTYLFVLENPATLPALAFLFFRLAENRKNIKLVLSDKILESYEPHVHRWHTIGCLELIKSKSIPKLVQKKELIIISEKENVSSAILLRPYCKNHNIPLLPYTLHPHQVFTGKLFFLDYFRRSERKHKIFFSGNYHESSYNKIFKDYPDIVNRYKALQFLKISSGDISYPKSKNEYLESNHFFNWIDWSNDTNLDRRIDEHDWLKILSLSSFSLCLPGVHMPMCHNIIEAMAVGTIPITQYGFLFSPPLSHGVNCIHFNDEMDLVQKINEIKNMPDSKVEQLRKNVITYFESNIDPINFIKEIRTNKSSEIQYFNEY